MRPVAAALVLIFLSGGHARVLCGEETGPVWPCLEDDHDCVAWQRDVGYFTSSSVLHGDKVLVSAGRRRSTNRLSSDRDGVLACYRAADGKLLWESLHPNLPQRIHDMLAVCSKAAVDGKRVYYQSNRGELMCVDLEGFSDGNDGPDRDEKQTAAEDVDVVWRLDMIGELGVFKVDAGDVANPLPCPLVFGECVYCVTGNGAYYWETPRPLAPSFLAVNKHSGKVVWSSNAPGKDICYGQWAGPVAARVGDHDVIIFPAGDGRLYGFEPETGKLSWRVDANEPGATLWGDRKRGTRGFPNAAPTVAGSRLFMGLNHEYEFRSSRHWPIVAVDLARAETMPQDAVAWRYGDDRFSGTFASVATDEQEAYVLGEDGRLLALEQSTGRELWHSGQGDMQSYFAGPKVHAGKVFVAADYGTMDVLAVYAAGRTKKYLGSFEFPEPVISTPAVAGNRLYVTTYKTLYAIDVPQPLR